MWADRAPTLDSLEDYSQGRQAIREELGSQKQRLDRLSDDIQRFGKTSENFMAMWRHKGCDK
jgi:hypothetical protein